MCWYRSAISLQAFRDDAFRLRRLLDAQPDGRRGPGPWPFRRGPGRSSRWRDDRRFAAGLLRRHVGGGSDHHALAVAALVNSASREAGARIWRGRNRKFDVAARADEDVRRFDVAMDDACSVRSIQRVAIWVPTSSSTSRRAPGPSWSFNVPPSSAPS